MIRFAVAVTVMEILLTLAAVLSIRWADSGEPFMTEGEFERLGIPVEKYSTDRRLRFGSLFSYDTSAQIPGGGAVITVSVRVNCPPAEYDARISGERFPKLRAGDEAPVVNDESWAGEPGYAVRQCGSNGARAEVVRFHGSTMLIVRAVQLDVKGNAAHANAARCERMARLIQEHLAQRLGWRDPAW